MVTQEAPAPARHPRHDDRHATPPPPPPGRRRGLLAVAVLLLIFAVAGGLSLLRRHDENKALAGETSELAVPTVSVVRPAVENGQNDVVLPGAVQAYIDSPIYARTNGYLLHWYKDIGSHVRKGELLADIDTPEVDQELNQARAARQQVEAQLQLARVSAQRWENLLKSDSVSRQEADTQTSGFRQAQANLAAADANVRRLEQLESFKHVYAPFTGVITRRNVDVGALINAGNGGSGQQLFNLAQIDPLRVYVNVPQTYAPSMHAGVKAWLDLDEFPGQKFDGTVVRTADAIDLATRTLLTEVDVPNKSGQLLPGAYARVHFNIRVLTPRITIPSNAMLFRAQGPQAAVVDAGGHVHLVPIQIGRDYGNSIEILSGLGAQDRVIVNPPDSINEGEFVHVAGPAPAAGAAPAQEEHS